jgi:TRAP-type C4-dicarboxylate transport system permease small subunit
MSNVGKKLVLFIEGISEYTGYIAGFAILGAALLQLEGVVTSMLGGSPYWQPEYAISLLILGIFVGAAYTQKYKGHLGVDLVTSHLPPKPRAIMAMIGTVVGFLVCVIMAKYLWGYWWGQKSYHSETMAHVSLAYTQILLPLGLTLLALEYIAFFYREYTNSRKGTAKAEIKSAETFSPHGQLPSHTDKPKARA